MKRLPALLFAALCLVGSPAAAIGLGGPVRVIDGDTIEVRGQIIRLLSIDAPEMAQRCGKTRCGQTAAAYLSLLTRGRSVSCTGLEKDRYDRLLAHCRADGADLGAQMVAAGQAVVFRRYGDEYDAEEQGARAAGLGFWAEPDAQMPWDFRVGKWQAAEQKAPRPGCPIKGNISAAGAHIYHTPHSASYEKTRIAPDRGERWFCSESEALAAGWRAPRN